MLYATATGQASWAVRDVSFTIGAGDFLCAVGPSGCGKTTILNTMAGFMRPTKGVVRLEDGLITGPSPDRGVVFQEYGLFPWLTVRKNIEFGLRARGISREERKALIDTYLGIIGMDHAKERYPFELSGGMRQRVAFARALVNRPRLLLMDEPFAAVDALTRTALQVELVKLWKRENFACFFITHSIEEAAYLGQAVMVMSANPGRLKAIVPVPLPYPRDRDSTDFRSVTRNLHELLDHA